MTDHLKQSVSALLDEEASEIEVHRLLREFESDGEIKSSFVRFQQIRAVSQGQHILSETQHLELHSRISSAIDAEDTPQWSEPRASKWQKPAAGFAVAASLVVAVLVGVNFQSTTATDPSSGLVSAPDSRVIDVQTVSTNSNLPAAVHNSQTLNPQLSSIDDFQQRTESSSIAFNENDLELKELDEAKQQRLREYLMRHDRMSQMNQMNNKARTVNYQAPKRSGQN